MTKDELQKEIAFGLENLEKIYLRIVDFVDLEVNQDLKVSGLTDECFGYYNAIEHLILRVVKYLKIQNAVAS